MDGGTQQVRGLPRTLVALLVTVCVVLVAVASCATARRASQRSTPSPPAAVTTAIAPARVPGLDGTAGMPPPNVCTALAAAPIAAELGGTVRARPNSWNDAGVPSMDLCAVELTRPGSAPKVVVIGISALPAQRGTLDRLVQGLGGPPGSDPVAEAPEIASGAWFGPGGAAYVVEDRAVRLTGEPSLERDEAAAIAAAIEPLVAGSVLAGRITDSACQPSGSMAERFLGVSAQLRRDYRVRGGLTCIWGTAERTVAIMESIASAAVADPMPEAHRTPRPRPAPVGDEAYFLPAEGQLVFRSGRRVVRVSALADPPVQVTLDDLLEIVRPIMPLFLR